MKIQGINNKVKFGQLLPNIPKEIKSLKDFFYKLKNKTEKEIYDLIKNDNRIILENHPIQIAETKKLEEEKKLAEAKKKKDK